MPGKLIGYARVSTSDQDTDRQQQDLLAAGVRRDDLYVDHGVSGARDKRPALDQCLDALQAGDTLVITTLDRLGRSTTHMLSVATDLQEQGISLKVLNLGGDSVDTTTPMGKMMFTVMAALAEMELEIKRERMTDSIAKRRAKGGDLGGRRQAIPDDIIHGITQDIEAGMSASAAVRKRQDQGIQISRATYYRRLKELEEVTP
jgi:DNA invertase Pin-like site-specific DNA recombinase